MTNMAKDTPERIAHYDNMGIGEISQNILSCCILIVDDDELHCQLMAIILAQDGFHNLHFAKDGREAILKADYLMPDMIILDILMPNVDGLDVCRTLRKKPHFRNTPIIAHTIKNSPEDRADIYDAGATDIFPKPVSEREVHNRVYMYLKYSCMVKGLRQYHDRLARDLGTARSMQDALLPDRPQLDQITKKYQVAVEYKYESSDELGGDFWGIELVDDSRFLIYIVDFSGHGIAASLNTFRLHSIITNYQKNPKNQAASPAKRLKTLNRDLFRLLPVEQYATMLCGEIDVVANTFTYAAAAATAPVKLMVGTERIEFLDPTGFPLGMIEEATYENHTVPFNKGEMLFLYSDVLTESHDITRDQKDDLNSNMIGEDGFIRLCAQVSLTLKQDNIFLEQILKLFDERVERPLLDDLTAVTFHRH